LNAKDRQIIKAAGEKALANRKKGFHCSESVFLANNCEYVYQTASEIAVELILEASKVVPECQKIF
jgi:hypothetical protein